MHFIPAHDGPRGTLRRAIAVAANPTPREYHVTSEKNAADWLRCLAGSTAVQREYSDAMEAPRRDAIPGGFFVDSLSTTEAKQPPSRAIASTTPVPTVSFFPFS